MKNSSFKVAAGIVLYNPNVPRLIENINAIIPQVDELILIENGSKDISYLGSIIERFRDYDVPFKVNNSSKGIAYALNQVCLYCWDNHINWAITLDQDSVVSNDIIAVYKRYVQNDIGILSPKIIDRNFHVNTDNEHVDLQEINWCITSAAFTNVKAWHDVGGFDTQMFIDWVDTDICYAMRAKGYKVMKTDSTHILHELGTNAYVAKFLGHEVLVLNRPAFRYYYVARNRIYMARKWKTVSLKHQLKEIFYSCMISSCWEHHKWANLKAFVRGILDGLRMKPEYNSLEHSCGR